MNQKLIAIIAVLVIAASAGAVYVITDNGKDSDSGNDGETLTDCMGREVVIPENLDDGIVTVGWNVLKVLSYFEAREHVSMVDMMETMPGMGSMQAHYYCYDMAHMDTHADSMMAGLTEAEAQKIMAAEPSLIIFDSYFYNLYKDIADSMAKKCPLVVLDLSALSNLFYEEKDGKFVVESNIQKSLHVLGDILKEEDRDEEIIATLNATLDDLVAHRISGESSKVNLSGSQMGMASGNLNNIFPLFNVFAFANAENAAKGYTVNQMGFGTINVEEYTSTYDFDIMFYDPSAPGALSPTSIDNQKILEWLYGLQGTADEKEIYVLISTALCGYDMLNVIADIYFVEHVVGNTLTIDEMETKMTALYTSLFGNEVGGGLWNSLCSTVKSLGEPYGVYTGLWEKVKVGESGGNYTLVSASA